MDKNYIFLKEIHQKFQICTQSNSQVPDIATFKFIKSVSQKKLTIISFLKHNKKSQELIFLFSHNIHFHIGSNAEIIKIEHVLDKNIQFGLWIYIKLSILYIEICIDNKIPVVENVPRSTII